MVSSYVDVSQYINEKMPEIEDMYERVRYNILQDKFIKTVKNWNELGIIYYRINWIGRSAMIVCMELGKERF